jgi:hypothetical protein
MCRCYDNRTAAFAANRADMQDRVAAWVDRERWPIDLQAEFYVWAADALVDQIERMLADRS